MHAAPVPIIALDVPDASRATALLDRLGPAADFVKVGLQLFIAEGPSLVHALRARGLRVFLDLKLHDIPNTVASAVRSAAALEVDLLTVHASGGGAMLRAARDAAGDGAGRPRLLAVTVLTSLSAAALAEAWGRAAPDAEVEVVRLARLTRSASVDGIVASVREVGAVRHEVGDDLLVLTPGIRTAGADAGDQSRVATPADAARAGVDFVVLGRTVTAAPDPEAALHAVLSELASVGVTA